jgi:hypothetical protein
MASAKGESQKPTLRPAFERRINLEFHAARITTDGGLLAYRKLEDGLDLTNMAASVLGDGSSGV